MGEHMNTRALNEYSWLNIRIQGFTGVYMGVHENTGVYRGIHGCK